MNRATTVAPLSHYNANYPAQSLAPGLAQNLKPLQPMALRLPGADRPWRHALAQWQAALCSLVREHRLQPERGRPYTAEVTLTEDLFVRWQRALDIPAAAAAGMPLVYHPHQRALLTARVLNDLGVHRRHAWHVQHHTEQVAKSALISARGPQHLQCSLRKAVRMGEDLALLVIETRLTAPGAGLLSVARDSYLVPQLPVADLAGLPADRALMREFVGLRHRTADIEPAAHGTCVRWLKLAPERVARFAHVSGLAATRNGLVWPSWSRRGRSPGLEGLALRNRIVQHLHTMGAQLEHLSLTLVRKAPGHGALCLVVAGRQFEVCDEAGRLLAFGQTAG
jgi:hypothetical protein